MQRNLMGAVLVMLAAGCGNKDVTPADETAVSVDYAYADINMLEQWLRDGLVTPEGITRLALQRIEEIDDGELALNAVVEVDPQAAVQAGGQGLLYGVPVLLKANIDTQGPLTTHAGSAALAQRVAPDNAFLVNQLIAAGAVVVGKANLSEWANFRSEQSTSGWSSMGGQTKNPHVLDRNPCGSSSGSAVAVAAGMVPLAIGTETHGSIVCPAGVNGIVGVKPSLGLVSRDGIIPIAESQDTAGPMTRNITDAARALQVMAVPDPSDQRAQGHPGQVDMLSGLSVDGLQGKRIGVWRSYTGAEQTPRVTQIYTATLAALQAQGAELIDPIGLYLDRDVFEASYRTMLYEFNIGLDTYFAGSDSLAQVIEFNRQHAARVMPWFGQDILELSADTQLTVEQHEALLDAGRREMSRRLNDVFSKFQLDAIIAPTNSPAWPTDWVGGDRFTLSSAGLAALSGRPAVTLPAGDIHGLPIGVSLVGHMWQDAQLLTMAYALEKALPPPVRPQFISSLEAP